MERLFLLANGYDRTKTKELMDNFDKTEKVQLTEGAVEQLRKIVAGSKIAKKIGLMGMEIKYVTLTFQDSASYTNDQILETIRDCKRRTGYTVCPHSATAVRYHFDHPTK